MRVKGELNIELVEVCLYIDALLGYIVPVVNEHEVRVNFPAAVCTDNDTNVVALTVCRVDASHATILKKRGRRKPCPRNHHTKLGHDDAPRVIGLRVVDFKVADQARPKLLQNDANLGMLEIAANIL